MTRKVNFAEAIKKTEWDIHEFICYIHYEKPYEEFLVYDPDGQEIGVDYNKEYRHEFRTYSLAVNDVKLGKLIPNRVETFPHDYEQTNYFFSPRALLNWAIERKDVEIPKELKEYLDYSFWFKIDYWFFDWAVILLTSKECPFPHETFNVFEKEETFLFAKKFKELAYESCFIDFSYNPSRIVNIAEKNGIPFPAQLKNAEDSYKDFKEKQIKLAQMKKRRNIYELRHELQQFSGNVSDILRILSGMPCKNPLRIEPFSGFKISSELLDFFDRAFRVGHVPIAKPGTRSDGYDSIIIPKEFVKWCLENKAPLEDNVKKLVGEIVGENNSISVSAENNTAEPKIQKLRNQQRHKERCRALAQHLWRDEPTLTTTMMAQKKVMIEIGCEGKVYQKSRTVEDWIRDLSPNKEREEKKDAVYA